MNLTKTNRTPQSGDVYLIRFRGYESIQDGLRPGIICQNNRGNIHSPNVIAVPLTTSLKKTELPTHVIINPEDSGLMYKSMALCENPACIPKSQILTYITTLSEEYMKQIAVASVLATGVISYLDETTLISARDKACVLNLVSA